MRILNSVVLPQPLGPRTLRNSPSFTTKERDFRTCSPSYSFTRFLRSISLSYEILLGMIGRRLSAVY